MQKALEVSQLNIQIKSILETTFISVYVQGEISNLTYHNSGHIYFSIKDANSVISCVMFKGNAKYLKFRLELGQKICINGNLTVYTPRGNYQLLCTKIEPSGQGSLALAYSQLKDKLEVQGFFKEENKKELPKFPKKIVLITSASGAAIEDMKKVATNRWPLVQLILIPTLVQGEDAKDDIVKSLKYANTLSCDLIILSRGGGSIEDLWAFNEEDVAIAIYESAIPIISAIGHESDYLISDYVADLRAATPSNAIELALPDINEYRIYIDNLSKDFDNILLNILNNKDDNIEYMKKLYEQNSIESKFAYFDKEIKLLKQNFIYCIEQNVKMNEFELDNLRENFRNNHPSKNQLNYFAQILKNNKLSHLEELKVNDHITLQTTKTIVSCTINSIEEQ